jgi:hypothetical protein
MPCFRRAGGAEDEDGEARAGEDGSGEGQEADVDRDLPAVLALDKARICTATGTPRRGLHTRRRDICARPLRTA